MEPLFTNHSQESRAELVTVFMSRANELLARRFGPNNYSMEMVTEIMHMYLANHDQTQAINDLGDAIARLQQQVINSVYMPLREAMEDLAHRVEVTDAQVREIMYHRNLGNALARLRPSFGGSDPAPDPVLLRHVRQVGRRPRQQQRTPSPAVSSATSSDVSAPRTRIIRVPVVRVKEEEEN